MILMDGNLLLYADRAETTDRRADRNWGEDTISDSIAINRYWMGYQAGDTLGHVQPPCVRIMQRRYLMIFVRRLCCLAQTLARGSTVKQCHSGQTPNKTRHLDASQAIVYCVC
jgi:hypothetical protein